jgi:hypothetical protein
MKTLIKSLLAFVMLFVVLSFAADQDGSAKVFICTGEYAYALRFLNAIQ